MEKVSKNVDTTFWNVLKFRNSTHEMCALSILTSLVQSEVAMVVVVKFLTLGGMDEYSAL